MTAVKKAFVAQQKCIIFAELKSRGKKETEIVSIQTDDDKLIDVLLI